MKTVSHPAGDSAIVPLLTDETRALVRLAALIAVGDEQDVRSAIHAATSIAHAWVEEVILQSYLFAGFPRALNAAREWRRASGAPAPESDEDALESNAGSWAVRGDVTCATVYGSMYDKLRVNIRALHPAFDSWMIVEGYGKVLSRPALDLGRRELCIVAVCAAARQERQLHSHLHGALNAGATADDVAGTLSLVADLVPQSDRRSQELLWARVRNSRAGAQ